MRDDLQYEGLEETDKRIHAHKEDIGYITIHEVLDRQSYEQLGRTYFNAVDLAPFLLDDEPEDREEREILTEADLGSLDDSGPSTEALARAACRWMRHVVKSNMVGRVEGRFKASLWRPKGEGQFHSARFVCRDHSVKEPPVRPIVVPAPTVVAPVLPSALSEMMPEGKAWRALGEGYTSMIGLLQQSYAHLATLQNTTVSNQNEQILRLQRVLEELMGEVTKMRVGLANVDHRRQEQDGESKVREELGKQFISEIGTFGRVVAAAKFGMAPELVELAEIVNASPELMDAMKSPEVRKLLKDEKTRKELAELLLMAARTPTAANTNPTAEKSAA